LPVSRATVPQRCAPAANWVPDPPVEAGGTSSRHLLAQADVKTLSFGSLCCEIE
jgi:hypothetical protein